MAVSHIRCIICGESQLRLTFLGHIANHIGFRPHQCRQCEFNTAFETEAIDHESITKGHKVKIDAVKSPYFSRICRFVYNDSDYADRNQADLEDVLNRPLVCQHDTDDTVSTSATIGGTEESGYQLRAEGKTEISLELFPKTPPLQVTSSTSERQTPAAPIEQFSEENDVQFLEVRPRSVDVKVHSITETAPLEATTLLDLTQPKFTEHHQEDKQKEQPFLHRIAAAQMQEQSNSNLNVFANNGSVGIPKLSIGNVERKSLDAVQSSHARIHQSLEALQQTLAQNSNISPTGTGIKRNTLNPHQLTFELGQIFRQEHQRDKSSLYSFQIQPSSQDNTGTHQQALSEKTHVSILTTPATTIAGGSTSTKKKIGVTLSGASSTTLTPSGHNLHTTNALSSLLSSQAPQTTTSTAFDSSVVNRKRPAPTPTSDFQASLMQLERPTTSASLLGSLYQQQQTQGSKTVDEPKVHCRKCNKWIRDNSAYKLYHVSSKHLTSLTFYRCLICNRSFSRSQQKTEALTHIQRVHGSDASMLEDNYSECTSQCRALYPEIFGESQTAFTRRRNRRSGN